MGAFYALAVVATAFFFPLTAQAVTFEIENWHSQRHRVIIWGRINKGDGDRFQTFLNSNLKAGRLISNVAIYSPGGDVAAAISMGEQIRKLNAATWAPFLKEGTPTCSTGSLLAPTVRTGKDCDCQSACFIVWVGGVGRNGDYVGVHRPYYGKEYFGNLSPEEAAKAYQEVIEEARRYFAKMDVPSWSTSKMFSVASVNMKFLTSDEIAQFNNVEPWKEEYVITKCGRMATQNPEQRRWLDCAGPLFDKIHMNFALEYLRVYGDFSVVPSTLTPPAPPPPIVRTLPTPTPEIIPRITVTPPTTTPASGLFNMRDNRDPDGQDIRRIRNVAIEACNTACAGDAGCQAFSYDKWNRECFLKTNVTALRLDPRSITGVRSSLGKLPGVPDNARMEPPFRGKYFPGSGYSVVTVSSVEGCSDNCYRDLACVAYSFTRADRSCRLFNTTGEYFRQEGYDAGIKTQVK